MKKWKVYHHIFLLPNFLLKRGRLNRNSFKTLHEYMNFNKKKKLDINYAFRRALPLIMANT